MRPSCPKIFSILLLFVSISLTAQPSIGGYNVYYGHLHNHSNVSDGTGTPDDAYNYAKNTSKLDFFSLADHSGSIDAAEWTAMQTAADKYNTPGIFTAFRGFEWTSSGSYGHVAIINTTDYCTTSSPTNTFASLCTWLNTRECVAFFNHPGRENAAGTEFSHFSTTPTLKMVGIELWNKSDSFSNYYYNDGYYASDGNKGYFDEALIRNWKIGASGSEDNHWGSWGNYCNYRLAVLATANTREDIYAAFKAKRFFSTLDKNIALSFKIGGNEMGSTLIPGTYGMTILATDADGELFTQVQLFKNGAVVNTWTPNSASPSISTSLTFATNEYYYVKVTQTDGDEAISSPIWISGGNQSPYVTLTSPSIDQVFLAPSTITLNANASDSDGTITKVEFYQGSTLISTDLISPYSYAWTNVQEGIYSLTVKATDNSGASTTSTPVIITVVNPGTPVTSNFSIVSGLDDVEESDAGAMYTNSTDIELVYDTYNSAGNQIVGLRFANQAIPKNAVISNAYIQFTCDETNTAACNLSINGEASDNSSAFTTDAFNVSARTRTTASVSWIPAVWPTADAATIDQRTPDISSIVQEIVNRAGYSPASAISLIITGSGTRTAEAYEGIATSAAKLVVTYAYPVPNQSPTVSITAPANGSAFISPASITISATASDTDGTVMKVDFYSGSTLLSSDNGSPYSYIWNNVTTGIYTITAIAYDDDGASTTSTTMSVTVNAPNKPPVVSITSPAAGASFTATASVTLTASASDPDGTISQVSFYQGSTLLGSDNTSPYSYTWNNVAAGSYTLTAIATDNTGSSTTSTGIAITVNSAPTVYTFAKRIDNGSDDVEESASGSMLLTSDDIELVYDTKTTGNQVVGLRFNSVTIPKGASITNAYIQFTVDEKTNATCNLTIKGENNDNATGFMTTSKNVSTRPKTAALVNWKPANWPTVGASGTAQMTPNLKGIVQEIINRTGWVSGNSLAFILTGSGTRTTVAYETAPLKAALLTIQYTTIALKSEMAQISIPQNQTKPDKLKCYPVPFSHELKIEFYPSPDEIINSVELFDQTGKKVIHALQHENQFALDLPNLIPGIYILRLKTNIGLYEKTVIKK